MSKKILIGFIVLGFLAILFFVGISSIGVLLLTSPIEGSVIPRPPKVEKREIASDFQKNLEWHRDDIYIRHFSRPSSGLITGYGKVVFVSRYEDSRDINYKLTLLDSDTGEILWQSKQFGDYEAFAISEDRAYVLLNEGRVWHIFNTGESPEPTTTLEYFSEATQFFMFPPIVSEKLLIYYYEREQNGFLVNTFNLNGQEIDDPLTINANDFLDDLLFFEQPFFLLNLGDYHWFDAKTFKELWHIPNPMIGRMDSWPILENDILFMALGSKDIAVIALDATNGQELWKTDKEFGSNVIFHRDRLYALRNDSVLVGFDPETGQVETEIPFSSTPIDAGSWDYWLASDRERLFVYFGDSQNLFALDVD